jgi:hypothetical protein
VYRGRGFGRGYRFSGRGLGNPYPYCRWYPWLPRRWWAYPAYTQPSTPPQAPFDTPLPTYNKEQEKQMLTQQIQILETQMDAIRKRLEELSK